MSDPTSIAPKVLEMFQSTTAAVLRLQARCDALEVIARVLGRKAGLDDAKIQQAIRGATEAAHQQLLERAESLDPQLAVDLDRRGEVLPDDLDRFL